MYTYRCSSRGVENGSYQLSEQLAITRNYLARSLHAPKIPARPGPKTPTAKELTVSSLKVELLLRFVQDNHYWIVVTAGLTTCFRLKWFWRFCRHGYTIQWEHRYHCFCKKFRATILADFSHFTKWDISDVAFNLRQFEELAYFYCRVFGIDFARIFRLLSFIVNFIIWCFITL